MRSRLKVVGIALAAVALAVFVVLKLLPSHLPPEEQILTNIVELQNAVHEKDIRGTMRHVSETYRDPVSESKRALHQLALSAYRQRGDFQVVLQPERPLVTGREATVSIRVDFAIAYGQAAHRVAPFTVQTRWAQEKGKWRIVWADGYMEGEKAFEEAGF